jgi:16S rRNA (guanine966-N2)-methyltransferase
MRIVGGRWAGLELTSPGARVRPTREPLRDACMRHLGSELLGARMLDLFAGSGAVGLEALSRGAKSCDFVENGTSAIHALKANVAAVKRSRARTRIFLQDAIPFAERLSEGAYDIAYCDPPYESRKLDRILRYWSRVPFAPILVVEHAPDHELGIQGTTLAIDDAMITILTVAVASRGDSPDGP